MLKEVKSKNLGIPNVNSIPMGTRDTHWPEDKSVSWLSSLPPEMRP